MLNPKLVKKMNRTTFFLHGNIQMTTFAKPIIPDAL